MDKDVLDIKLGLVKILDANDIHIPKNLSTEPKEMITQLMTLVEHHNLCYWYCMAEIAGMGDAPTGCATLRDEVVRAYRYLSLSHGAREFGAAKKGH